MPKLLLADDSVTIQRVIELTFADEKIQVIAVGDGYQAIQRIDSERPDVVLADVGMPERNGYEVAAHVKKTPHLAHIPVLLLTGAFEPIDEARARAVGCDGVLVKPFEPQMVINRVKDLLAGRRPTSLWQGEPVPVPAPQPQPATRPASAAGTPLEGQVKPIDSLDEYFDRLDAAFSQYDPPGPAPAPPAPEPPPPPPVATAPGVAVDFGEWDLPSVDRRAAAPPILEPSPQPGEPEPARVQAAAPAAAATAGTLETPAPSRVEGPIPSRVEGPTLGRIEAPAPTVGGAAPSRIEEPVPARVPGPVESSVDAAASAPAEAPGSLDRGLEADVPAPAEGPALAEAFAALLAAEEGLSKRPVAVPGAAVSEELVDEVVRRVLTRMSDQVVRQTVLQVAERLVREEIDRVKKGAS